MSDPDISPLVIGAASRQDSLEQEKLFLPSDLSQEERLEFDVSALARQEILLRTAQAEEESGKVKTVAKSITTMLQFRSRNIRGQDRKTRSEHDVASTFVRRDCHIMAYNHARAALIRLGVFDPTSLDSPYPELKPEDTHRHDVNIKRRTGDSQRREGLLWRIGAASDLLAGIEPGDDLPVGLDDELVPIPLITPTRMTQRISHPTGPQKKKINSPATSANSSTQTAEEVLGWYPDSSLAEAATPKLEGKADTPHEKRAKKKEKKYRKDSWLWSRGTHNHMSQAEVDQWELEGDRIQWFRAEAEMYRWMEQFEIKHAEFARIIAYFRKMASVWTSLATTSPMPGPAAYARRHAAIFLDLANDTDVSYKKVGHPCLVELPEGAILADQVAKWREDWLAWMKPLVSCSR